jgi:hypothetical protein
MIMTIMVGFCCFLLGLIIGALAQENKDLKRK